MFDIVKTMNMINMNEHCTVWHLNSLEFETFKDLD